MLDHEIDITGDAQMYIYFDKDVTTSPDATISEIVKEINEKKTEISSDSDNECKMELEQNKLPTKTDALHCIETIKN